MSPTNQPKGMDREGQAWKDGQTTMGDSERMGIVPSDPLEETEAGSGEPTTYGLRRIDRIPIQVKLMLGPVLAAGVMTTFAALTGTRSTSALMAIAALLALLAGIGTTAWAIQPLARLSDRARELAGNPTPQERLDGGFFRALHWDQAIPKALDEIERSLFEIQALNRISTQITSDQKLESIMRRVVEEAVALLQADAGIIGLWDAQRQVFKDRYASNLPIAFPEREFGAELSFSSHVAKRGKVIFLDDYMRYARRIRELDHFQFRATVGAPLMLKGESKGSLIVLSRDPQRKFTGRDGELLATLANQVATALEQARLHQVTLSQLEENVRAAKELAQKTRQLERALATIVKVQESERARIAVDMHDGVVQSMVGALFELQAAMAHFPDHPEMVRAKQTQARDLLQEAVSELRRVIYDLRPFVLDQAGLAPAVERLAESFEKIMNFPPSVLTIGTPCRFFPDAETAAYRIIQESLANVSKHALASTVQITLGWSPEHLELTVRDDGTGFLVELASPMKGKHIGLVGMMERARSVGGKLEISSWVDHGTEIKALIPYWPPESMRPAADSSGQLIDLEPGALPEEKQRGQEGMGI
jgi:signal transduction histidine kinase